MIFNPRREHYPEGVEEEQIRWEYTYLRNADMIIFYFAPETLCPITLFEYGFWLANRDGLELFVCCHPDYKRLRDVEIQTSLCRPDLKIYTDLNEMTDRISYLLED